MRHKSDYNIYWSMSHSVWNTLLNIKRWGILLLLGTCLTITYRLHAVNTNNHYQQQFIRRLLPIITLQNTAVSANRQWLLTLRQYWGRHHSLSSRQYQRLNRLTQYYKLPHFSPQHPTQWNELLFRVNLLPPSLVIAQAINESNWGRSRFAVDANNYFGVWCYQPGCGLIPRKRPRHRQYQVKAYPSMRSSLADYYRTLNTGSNYRRLRLARAQLIGMNRLSGLALAGYLHGYSTKRDVYIKLIRQIIKRHDLTQYDVAPYID